MGNNSKRVYIAFTSRGDAVFSLDGFVVTASPTLRDQRQIDRENQARVDAESVRAVEAAIANRRRK